MFVVETTEKYNGCDVVLVGKSKDKLVRHYIKDGEAHPIPMSDAELAVACTMSYAKDGKTYFTQIGDARVKRLRDDVAVGIHKVQTGKRITDYFVVWNLTSDGAFPKYKVPVVLLKDGMAALA